MKPTTAELLAAVAKALYRDVAADLDEPARSQVIAASAIVRRVALYVNDEIIQLTADNQDMRDTLVALEPVLDGVTCDLLVECRRRADAIDPTPADPNQLHDTNQQLQSLVESAIGVLSRRATGTTSNVRAIDLLIRRMVERAARLHPAVLRV